MYLDRNQFMFVGDRAISDVYYNIILKLLVMYKFAKLYGVCELVILRCKRARAQGGGELGISYTSVQTRNV